jgi:DNA-binding GntR family transcriptional regulator
MALDFEIAEVKNLSTVIADRLSDMIRNGQLRPNEHLVQTDLAERFGVSRVAIRDALQLLRQRGLAVMNKTRATTVCPVSTKTIQNLCSLRCAVESYAVLEAVPKLDADIIRRLRQIISEQTELIRQEDFEQLLTKDWQFHSVIYSLCENELLMETVTGLWSRMQQARSLAQVEKKWGVKWGNNSVARHSLLLNALAEGNGPKAAEIVKKTIELSGAQLLEGLRETGWIK